MTQRNRVLNLGERQIGARCNEFFQGGSEGSALINRHIQGTAPQVRARPQNSPGQTARLLRIKGIRPCNDRARVLRLLPQCERSLNHHLVRIRIFKTGNLERIRGKYPGQ